VGINRGQRFVKENGRDIGSHQPPSHGDLLFGVGPEILGSVVKERDEAQHLGHLVDP